MLPTCQWDHDPPLADVYIYFFFVMTSSEKFDLNTVWYKITAETKCSPLYKWFVHTSFRTISRMLQLPETQWRRGTLIIIIITIIIAIIVIIEALWPLFLDFEPKPLVSECILVGLEQCNFDTFNTVRYTNTAMKPCLPLKYWVYPKRSFHASFFVLVLQNLFVFDVRWRGSDFDSFKFV